MDAFCWYRCCTSQDEPARNEKGQFVAKDEAVAEEEVVEVAPSTIKFLDMGDRGHQQIAAQYNMSQLPGDVYNSPDVYDNNVGGEQVDGS